MAHEEGSGWPLGLQPLNMRARNNANLSFGSMSFGTFISDSPTSFSDSSSDFDTESSGSFFQDRSITLGSLIGIASILDVPRGGGGGRRRRRSCATLRRRRHDTARSKKKHSEVGSWTWLSLCLKSQVVDGDDICCSNKKAPSLGDYLEVERKANNNNINSSSPLTYELAGLLGTTDHQSIQETNTLFSDGCIAPPPFVITASKPRRRHQICCW